jgi:hypothetical protein
MVDPDHPIAPHIGDRLPLHGHRVVRIIATSQPVLLHKEQLQLPTHSGGCGTRIVTAPQWQLPLTSPCVISSAS